MFKHFVIFIICTFITVADVKENVDCDLKANDKIDSKVAKLMVFGEHGRRYPENGTQLKLFCDESTSLLSTIDQYKNKCLKGTLKYFASLFLYSNRNSVKRFCSKNNKQINEFLKAATCINAHTAKLNRCMGRMIDRFIGIKYAEDRKKINFICCGYVKLVDCFTFEISKGKCTTEMDTLLVYLQSLMGNFLEASCGEYTETEKCQQLGEPPRRRANETIPKSILYPLFEIIDSLPQ